MISIILPVYNGEKYIQSAIKSVLAQTYQNLELIIVDDGSIDKTKEVINKFDDKRIKYIYQQNKGQAGARNKGLDLAKGDFIGFIDADDIYERNKLEEQIEILKNDDSVDVVYNDVLVFSEQQKDYILKSELEFENSDDFSAYVLFRQIVPSPASMLIKSKLASNIRFDENYRYTEDYKFIIDLASIGNFRYINKVLYRYRRHDKNVTNNHIEQLKCECEIIKELGYEKISKIVEKSNFNDIDKKILLAKILMKIEENTLAKSILENMKEKNEYVYFYLGNLNYMDTNFEEANKNYLRALEVNSKLAEVYNNLGVTEYLLGNKEVARKCFENALKINSIYMDANYNIDATEDFKITKRELRKQLTNYNA
ncbi:MAG: glycosyltransferase [Sarcina sp.]